MHKPVRWVRSEYPHPEFPADMRGMQLLPDVIWLRYHGPEVTGWSKDVPETEKAAEGARALLRKEREKAAKWHKAWLRVLGRRSQKECIRWQKRTVWALHRWERARRAELPEGPNCWFCERPGHDESEGPCEYRMLTALKWEACGRIWRGKEAA